MWEVSWGALGIKLREEKSSCGAFPAEASANARSSSGAKWPFRGDLEKALALDLEWPVLPEPGNMCLGPRGALGVQPGARPLKHPTAGK